MIDFSPLLSQPKMVLLGAAGQFGIFGTLILATLLGFPLNQAASIGVIGAIDGPTSIFVATKLAPEILAPIAVAAYSYMSLIPIIQPPIMKLMTTKKERLIRMEYAPRPVSRKALVLFPILATLMIGLLVPAATPLISMLMLGNLLAREPRRRTAEPVGTERNHQCRYVVPGPDDWLDDGSGVFPQLANHWYTPVRACLRSVWIPSPALLSGS